MQRLLGLGGFFLGAVTDHSIALGQIQVECDERPMLQTQRPQCRTVNLRRKQRAEYAFLQALAVFCNSSMETGCTAYQTDFF